MSQIERDERQTGTSRAWIWPVVQIEKQFGKGRSCGWQKGAIQRRRHSDWRDQHRLRARRRRRAAGRIVEIFGPESSGKTTLALQ